MLNNHAWVKGKDKPMDANVTKYKKFIGIKKNDFLSNFGVV